MGRMYVLDDSGHAELAWDLADDDSRAAAEREFHALRRRGYQPFTKRRPADTPVNGHAFDAEAHEIFWVRPLVGG